MEAQFNAAYCNERRSGGHRGSPPNIVPIVIRRDEVG